MKKTPTLSDNVTLAVADKNEPSKLMTWVILMIAVAIEVFGSTSMKLSCGFTVLPWGIAAVVGYFTSLALFTRILKYLPLGLAYGIWGGIGCVATTIIGCLLWGDPFTGLTAAALVFIIGGVVLMSKGDEEAEAAAAATEAAERTQP